MKRAVIFICALLGTVAVFAQNMQKEGDDFAAAGNYKIAETRYRMCMDSDEECALKLFRLIFEGKINPLSPEEPFQLISPIAQKGNAEAQYYLGEMYTNGILGVQKDELEAGKWILLYFQQNYVHSRSTLTMITPVKEIQEPVKATSKEDEVKPETKAVTLLPKEEEVKPDSNAVTLLPKEDEVKPTTDAVTLLPNEEEAINIPKDDIPVETKPQNLSVKKEATNGGAGMLYALGGVSIAAGIAATVLLAKDYTTYGDAKKISGKEYNLGFTAAGMVVGGVCFVVATNLKKKARERQSSGMASDVLPAYRDNKSRIDLMAIGNTVGLRLVF